METKLTCARCGSSHDYDARSGGYDPIASWPSQGIMEPMHVSCSMNELIRRKKAKPLIGANTVDEHDRAREYKLTERRS